MCGLVVRLWHKTSGQIRFQGVNTMKNKSVFIGNWYYTKPDLIPNKNGDIVIIKRVSFGPLEAYEWGIDVNNTPYEFISSL